MQFDSWVSTLEALGIVESKIAEIEADRTKVLANLEQEQADIAKAEKAATQSKYDANIESVRAAQADFAGTTQQYNFGLIGSRYGRPMSSLSDADEMLAAFSSSSPQQLMFTLDNLGIGLSQYLADIKYLSGILNDHANAVEADRIAFEENASAIRENLQAMRDMIDMNLATSGPNAISMSAYYMNQIREIQKSDGVSMDDLSTMSMLLSQWYTEAVSEQQQAASLWAQVADRVDSLIGSIDSTIQSITYGSLSTALPSEKFATAQEEYNALRAKVLGGSATQSEIQNFIGFSQEYLGIAQSNYKSSRTYQDIYDGVLRDLEVAKATAAMGGYDELIYRELTEIKTNVDLSAINSTYQDFATWIENRLDDMDSGFTLSIDWGDIPSDVQTVLEAFASTIDTHGADSVFSVDFMLNAIAGGTNILWSDFETVLEAMQQPEDIILGFRAEYDASTGMMDWAELSGFLSSASVPEPTVLTIQGLYETSAGTDGISLSAFQSIMDGAGLDDSVIRRITTDITGAVEADIVDGVAVTSTPTDSVVRSIGDQVDRMYEWYGSLNNKLRDISQNTYETARYLENMPGYASGGIVPSRQLATVGESGPEAIVPLIDGGIPVQLIGGGSGAPVNITIQILDNQGTVRKEQVYEIADEVATLKFRNPSSADRRIYG